MLAKGAIVRAHVITRGMVMAILAAAVAGSEAHAQGTLTAADLAGIERLSVEYNRTLTSCLASEYADLFEQPEGFYESLNRGRVRGRARLESLVQSERHCTSPGQERPVRPAPKPVIESAGALVTGKLSMGEAGHYEDVYVKTPAGWRFRSRNLLPPKAEAAQFTHRDFAEIRALAGDAGQFEDAQMDTPAGPRFRSSGLIIDPTGPGKATGRARLAGGEGYYRDVYVKTGRGWRFESRTYEAESASSSR
jgi:hypothetical protein